MASGWTEAPLQVNLDYHNKLKTHFQKHIWEASLHLWYRDLFWARYPLESLRAYNVQLSLRWKSLRDCKASRPMYWVRIDVSTVMGPRSKDVLLFIISKVLNRHKVYPQISLRWGFLFLGLLLRLLRVNILQLLRNSVDWMALWGTGLNVSASHIFGFIFCFPESVLDLIFVQKVFLNFSIINYLERLRIFKSNNSWLLF